jgi:hypothetical protein
VQPWQRGKVDRRGGHVPRAHQEGGQRHVTPNLSSWQLPLLRRPEPLVIQTSRADSESDPDDLGAGNTTTNPVVTPPLEKEKVVVPRDKARVASEPLGSTAEDASERELVVVLSTEEIGPVVPCGAQMETREDPPPARLTPEMSEAARTLNVVSPVLGTEAGRQEGPTEHCGLPLDVALEAPTGVEDTADGADPNVRRYH